MPSFTSESSSLNHLWIFPTQGSNPGLPHYRQIHFFILKKLIYFNWRLITLHYCDGFCHGYTCVYMSQPWVYMCSPSWTPLPSPSPSHPSGSSQCTSPEHPVSCIEPGLAICFTYDNIWRVIPPSPSPTESKRLSFVVSHIGLSLPSF